MAKRREAHSRLGFAVPLGTIRFPGVLLADPLDVPWRVLDHPSARLGIAAPSIVKKYMRRRPAVHEHAREIRAVCGYRDLVGPVLEDLSHTSTRGRGRMGRVRLRPSTLRRRGSPGACASSRGDDARAGGSVSARGGAVRSERRRGGSRDGAPAVCRIGRLAGGAAGECRSGGHDTGPSRATLGVAGARASSAGLPPHTDPRVSVAPFITKEPAATTAPSSMVTP